MLESANLVEGVLYGRADPDDEAAISYRGVLNDAGLLIELRLANTVSPGPGKAFTLGFDLDDQSNGSESISCSFDEPGEMSCQLQRGPHTARGRANIAPRTPQILLTIFRTQDHLMVELDHIPVVELPARSANLVRGLALTVPPGEELVIRSIGLQRNPLPESRIPAPLQTHLRFLRDALASQTERNGGDHPQ